MTSTTGLFDDFSKRCSLLLYVSVSCRFNGFTNDISGSVPLYLDHAIGFILCARAFGGLGTCSKDIFFIAHIGCSPSLLQVQAALACPPILVVCILHSFVGKVENPVLGTCQFEGARKHKADFRVARYDSMRTA